MIATKQIMEELQAALVPQERFVIPEKIMHAMLELEEPEKLIKPILKMIETNPNVDFGTPGALVLFLEGLYDCGYEELLIGSVLRSPTPHNIWMLHRCYNDETDARHSIYQCTIEKLRKSDDLPDSIKKEIERYNWD